MKRLILNCCIMAGVLAVIFILTWFAPGQYPHDIAALINKREMLVSKKPPRLLFFGGSSLLTLNSPEIEKRLNYSVCNMGLWGGLSTSRYLDEIKEYLRPGDAVVITQEYGATLDPVFIDYINTNDDSKKFLFLMSPGRHIKEYCRSGDLFGAFKIMMQLCQMKTKSQIQNIVTFKFSKIKESGYLYYTDEFNGNGDRLNSFKILRPLDSTGKIFKPYDIKNHLFLNDFYNFAKKRNVKVLFYFSHFPVEEYRLNEKLIMDWRLAMKKLLAFPILNEPSDFAFPREYFADTIYHLNDKGERVRTEMLIRMLEKALL